MPTRLHILAANRRLPPGGPPPPAKARGACIELTIIPNFPQDLLEEHKRWHHARHSVDLDRPPIGYGQEFLTFHRYYIRKALAWYRQAGLDPRLVEPWPAVPEPIRQSGCYDADAEARILERPETFATADELGRFIEASGIHGCIHERAAQLYGDPDINDLDVAPHDTVFYNIHGMIDNWYRNWEGLGRFGEGMPYWSGRFHEAEGEVLQYRREDSSWWLGRPERPEEWREWSAASGGGSGFGDISRLVLDSRAAGADAGGAAHAAGNRIEWGAVGDSAAFGKIDDGRPFRVWDADKDGRLEVLFQSPFTGDWWEGSLRSGQLEWSQVRLQRTGRPTHAPDSLQARPRRKRKTRK